jgi:hypothetical protein
MRHEDFNTKYKDWLAGNGLDVTLSHSAMNELDAIFQRLVCLPNFKYISIRYKNGKGYFSAVGVPIDGMYAIEQLLTNDLPR